MKSEDYIYIGLGLVLIVVISRMMKTASEIGAGTFTQTGEDDTFTGGIDELNLTYPFPDWYQFKSDEFFTAVWAGMGEDEEVMVNILMDLDSNDDVKALATIYGSRAPSFWDNVAGGKPQTLIESSVNYLSDSDKEEVNQEWESKGISYTLAI